MAGRPRKFTPESLLDAWQKYMLECSQTGKFPTQEGFIIANNINHDTFYNYLSQEEYSDAKKIIDAMLLDKTVQEAMQAKNPAFLIFYLKNKFGWRDRQEIDSTISGSIEVHFSDPDMERYGK